MSEQPSITRPVASTNLLFATRGDWYIQKTQHGTYPYKIVTQNRETVAKARTQTDAEIIANSKVALRTILRQADKIEELETRVAELERLEDDPDATPKRTYDTGDPEPDRSVTVPLVSRGYLTEGVLIIPEDDGWRVGWTDELHMWSTIVRYYGPLEELKP